MFIFAAFLCKFPLLLHFCSNFDSGSIFVQTFILPAYLCKILFRLNICANFLSWCIFLQILMYIFFCAIVFFRQMSKFTNLKLLWESVVLVHRHNNKLIKEKYTWWSLFFLWKTRILKKLKVALQSESSRYLVTLST